MALALLVTGCGLSEHAARDRLQQAASFVALDVPADLAPTDATVFDTVLLAGGDELPTVIAGRYAEPQDESTLAVWTVPPGERLQDTPQLLDVDGPPTAIDLDGSPGLTALAGVSWNGSASVPYLFTSTDRRRWERVDLSGSSIHRPAHVAVDGDTVYVVGFDSEYSLVGVRAADGGIEELPLPEVPDMRSITALDAADGRLVIAASADDDAAHRFVLTSTDAGQEWTESTVAHADGFADAFVLPDESFLVLGSQYDTKAHMSRRAAWASSDGSTWEPDEIAGLGDHAPEGSSWFGDAAVHGETVVAPVLFSQAIDAYVTRRDADGTWTTATGADGRPLTVNGPADGFGVEISATRTGEPQTLVTGDGEARLYGPTMLRLGTLGDLEPWFAPVRTQDERPQAPLTATRTVFTSGNGRNSWRTTIERVPLAVEGDALVVADPEVPTDAPVVAAQSPDGTRVLLANAFEDPTFKAHSWTASGNEEWDEGEPLPSPGFTDVQAVTFAADRWFAVGRKSDDPYTAGAYAASWVSTDGAAWKPGGRMPDDGLGSSVNDVCALPDGGALAVGDIVQGERTVPVTWVSGAGGAWHRVDHEGEGRATECVTSATTTAVVTQTDVTRVLTTNDGKEFTEAMVADVGADLGDLTPVGDGYLAAGWVDDDHTGPVLWVSPDGRTWDWVSVPARSPASPDLVRAGDDVIVTVADQAGTQAWRLSEPEELLRAAGG